MPIQTTALEIFSQQADLSSDQMVSSDVVVPGGLAGRLNLAAAPRILPPTHRKPMSSNGKPLPAAPNESSRAATRIASGPLAEQLITAKHEQSVMEDPFTTSSHKRVPPVKQTAQEPDLKQVLRKHGIIIDQQKRTTNHDEEEEDPDKTLVNPADDDLESVLEEAMACGRTAVVDARCDPAEKCFPMIPAGAAATDVLEFSEEAVEA